MGFQSTACAGRRFWSTFAQRNCGEPSGRQYRQHERLGAICGTRVYAGGRASTRSGPACPLESRALDADLSRVFAFVLDQKKRCSLDKSGQRRRPSGQVLRTARLALQIRPAF